MAKKGKKQFSIPVFRPQYSKELVVAFEKTLKSGWWGSGPKAAEFEERFADYLGSKKSKCISLNSCTAALDIAGKLLNLKPGSEIIIPSITFVSTAFIASYNSYKPVFADVEKDTLNIDPEDIEKKITKKTKAIVVVHYGGHSCDMGKIMALAKKHNLYVIEDCAHAAGAEYKGKKLGTFGDIACFSFQAVKNLAIGDGGMLVINNKKNLEKWDKKARILRWVGINKDTAERTKDQYSWEYSITELGYKYQLPDLLAALALPQLKKLDAMNKKREAIAERYLKALKNMAEIEPLKRKSYATKHSYGNFCIKLSSKKTRDNLMQYLKQKGIATSVHYKPLFLHKLYREYKKAANCPVAENIWQKIMLLPMFPGLKKGEQEYIIAEINGFLG